MKKSISNFKAQHSFLVCIDSDGCVFDVMEVKHKECFCPATVNYWDLQAVSRFAREAWDFVNLYSVYRGINRFLALGKVLDLVSQREELKEMKEFKMPDYSVLKAWLASGDPLNNQSLEKRIEEAEKSKAEKNADESSSDILKSEKAIDDLKKILAWSNDCNKRISEMVRGVPPFPYVRESLEKLSKHADIVIVSATATEALMREWEEHGLMDLVAAVCGQEAGSKSECIAKAKKYYKNDACLMIGDAPGDCQAAKDNDISFYPISPLKEGKSWHHFHDECLDMFFENKYAGKKEKEEIAAFEKILPKEPKWKQD